MSQEIITDPFVVDGIPMVVNGVMVQPQITEFAIPMGRKQLEILKNSIPGVEETEFGYPFNAEWANDPDLPPDLPPLEIPDRLTDARHEMRRFSQFFGNGVFPNPSNGLQVISQNNTMRMSIMPGYAFVNGCMYGNSATKFLDIPASDNNYNRIDTITIRLDMLQRWIFVRHNKGVPSTAPVPPPLIRTVDIWEIKLADIFVGAGVNNIYQRDITDTRLDNTVCGVVQGLVYQVDTTTIFNQYFDWFEWVKSTWQGWLDQTHDEWEMIKDQYFDWFDLAQTDIALLQTFDFDNLNEYPGTARITEFLPSGTIRETLKVTDGTERLVAIRTNVFNADGTIDTILQHWDYKTGVLLKTTKIHTTFLANGNIDETVSHYQFRGLNALPQSEEMEIQAENTSETQEEDNLS